MTAYDEVCDLMQGMDREAIKRVVLAAARVCEARASVEERSMAVRQEARKCAAQIRHELICEDGEHICYECDGEGCYRCEGEGVCRNGQQPRDWSKDCTCDKELFEDHHPTCPARQRGEASP